MLMSRIIVTVALISLMIAGCAKEPSSKTAPARSKPAAQAPAEPVQTPSEPVPTADTDRKEAPAPTAEDAAASGQKPESTSSPDKAMSQADAAKAAKLKSAIHAYFSALSSRQFESAPALLVPDQRDTAKMYWSAYGSLVASLDQFLTTVDKVDAGQTEHYRKLIATLTQKSVEVGQVTFKNDSHAVVTIVPQEPANQANFVVQVRLIDGQWLVHDDTLPAAAGAPDTVDALSICEEKLKNLISDVEGKSLSSGTEIAKQFMPLMLEIISASRGMGNLEGASEVGG